METTKPTRANFVRLSLLVSAGLMMIMLVVLTAGCSNNDNDPETVSVSFMAGFRAQANLPFVAAYVAKDQGFFQEEGLDVTIRHSGGQNEHIKLLLADEVQFTTSTAAQVLQSRSEDIPVRAAALFGQRGDQGFVTRADSGIESPADFAGKTVGFKAGVVPAELLALLKTANLTKDDIELQGVGFDPRVFIDGGVEVYPVFLNNEPDTIRKAGLDINVIDPQDFGVPTLGVTYLVTEKMLKENADITERYLRATLRAVKWIETHVDESIDITLTYAEGADADHQQFLLTTDIENAQRTDGIGRGTVAQWEALHEMLVSSDVLKDAVEVSDAFDGSIVDSLYNSGEIK